MNEDIIHVKYNLIDTLVKNKIIKSKSEGNRLIKQGGLSIEVDGEWKQILKIEKCKHI